MRERTMDRAREKAAALTCWQAPVSPQPVTGGITNANFVVVDASKRYFVRIGEDIPEHGVMRFNERAASEAAFRAGLSPEVVHCEPGAMVLRFVEGKTLTETDVRDPQTLPRIVDLVKRAHTDMANSLRGPVLTFWVFHILRDYAARLDEDRSRMVSRLPELLAKARTLEAAVGPIELVFGHNDLLAANFIDDGERLWLIDWDYAGFNSPLFDLGGLASNNLLTPTQERQLLEQYYGITPNHERMLAYTAMKCASLLRESMWSMVSEHHSKVDFDYVAYTDENMLRFDTAYETFKNMM